MQVSLEIDYSSKPGKKYGQRRPPQKKKREKIDSTTQQYQVPKASRLNLTARGAFSTPKISYHWTRKTANPLCNDDVPQLMAARHHHHHYHHPPGPNSHAVSPTRQTPWDRCPRRRHRSHSLSRCQVIAPSGHSPLLLLLRPRGNMGPHVVVHLRLSSC